MITGTENHTRCNICGNYTVDKSGECHYGYCGENFEKQESFGERNEINIPNHLLGADGLAMLYDIQ